MEVKAGSVWFRRVVATGAAGSRSNVAGCLSPHGRAIAAIPRTGVMDRSVGTINELLGVPKFRKPFRGGE